MICPRCGGKMGSAVDKGGPHYYCLICGCYVEANPRTHKGERPWKKIKNFPMPGSAYSKEKKRDE